MYKDTHPESQNVSQLIENRTATPPWRNLAEIPPSDRWRFYASIVASRSINRKERLYPPKNTIVMTTSSVSFKKSYLSRSARYWLNCSSTPQITLGYISADPATVQRVSDPTQRIFPPPTAEYCTSTVALRIITTGKELLLYSTTVQKYSWALALLHFKIVPVSRSARCLLNFALPSQITLVYVGVYSWPQIVSLPGYNSTATPPLLSFLYSSTVNKNGQFVTTGVRHRLRFSEADCWQRDVRKFYNRIHADDKSAR